MCTFSEAVELKFRMQQIHATNSLQNESIFCTNHHLRGNLEMLRILLDSSHRQMLKAHKE